MREIKKRGISIVIVLLLVIVHVVRALPTGPSINPGESTRQIPYNPYPVDAQAGNVTRLTITGISITSTWQGYFGNVSGSLTLSDANNYTLYNWSLANPEGEVYAANDTVTWTNIQCFNFTADESYLSDANQKGATSLYGMNLTTLETVYGLNADDEDGVDETFSVLNTHDPFYTNSLQFAAGECAAVSLFNATGMSNSDQFQEALLYDPDKQTPVFASILENDLGGFNNETNDFQMLVLENGHLTDTEVTQYYFYVELG